MDKAISAADANRNFSKLLRDVREGQSYVVTSHGRPVAKIMPVGADVGLEKRNLAALLARLRAEPIVDVGRWSRDELYEDAP
jgi:prevent-host-death family protein